MAQLLSPADWAKYVTAINDASDSFNKEDITWHRFMRKLSRDGEEASQTYEDIILKGLVYYGYYKTWPDENVRVSGENDDTSLVVIFNKQYLKDLGYTNSNDYFITNPGYDKFFIKGIEYISKGDTDVAQAENDPLLIYIRLDRKQVSTGQNYHTEAN